jgi:predicted porin
MKKSLLAVAAMTAFAGAAQAQSSVTVYGILDVGYIGGNTTSATSSGSGSVTKVTGNQFGQSAEQTSRLGFKGTEDLGNGTQAVFTAEFGLAPQEADISGNSNLGLQNRQTFVGLNKNGLGQVAVGTQYTGIHNAAAVTDPGQLNNMMGNVIYAYSSGPAASAGAASATNGGIGNAEGNTVAYTVRMSNSLTAQSDAFAGFRANGMLVANNKNTTQTGATTGGNLNTNGFGIGADYTYKMAYVTAQYQAFKQYTTGGTAASAQVFNASGVAPITLSTTGNSTVSVAQGNNVQDNQFYAGATYDFGILKAYAQYISRKASATADTSYYVKRSAEQIGVRSFITPKIEGWASAGLGRYTAFGNTSPTANFNAWQLGSNYWLSKRTNLYAIYGATTTSNYTTPAGVTASQSGQNYAVGVRHTF